MNSFDIFNFLNLSTVFALIGESTVMIAALAALAASTALLLIFIILLFACKPFRNLFFHTDAQKSKKGKKGAAEKSKKSQPTAADNDFDNFEDNYAVAQKSDKNKKSATAKKRNGLAYSDSVPTVPLFVEPKTNTGKTKDEDIMKRTHEALVAMSYSQPRPTASNANSYVPTIVIPKTNTHDKPQSSTSSTASQQSAKPNSAKPVGLAPTTAAKPTPTPAKPITAKPTAANQSTAKPVSANTTNTKPGGAVGTTAAKPTPVSAKPTVKPDGKK